MSPLPFDTRTPCRFLVLTWVVLCLPRAQAREDEPPPPVSREDHEKLRDEIERLRREIEALRGGRSLFTEEPADTGVPAAEAETAEPAVPAIGEDEPKLPGYKGGLFDKPFLQGVTPQVYVGGYFDVEYRNPENQPHDFRFHRFIPFFYADLHERIKFASEIEIEDGSEVEIEFAFLDFLAFREANLRGGVILDPLGKFNLIHDSPINDLTDRPLVNQFIIPTTLREVGAGLFGTLTPVDSVWEVKYEAYVTSGFKGLDNGGATEFDTSNGLRDGRASKSVLGTRSFGDVNDSFAGVGRLSVSPRLGTEFGVSGYTGDYDEASDNNLTIAAVDALITLPELRVGEVPVGPVELQGEGAWAFIERNGFARASGVPGDMWGYYVQANYHFMPEFLTENAPVLFLPGSTFTLVTRWEQIDLDGARRRRLTLGLNYRPIESTAVKFDYQFNRATGTAPDSAEDDAFLISITSYF